MNSSLIKQSVCTRFALLVIAIHILNVLPLSAQRVEWNVSGITEGLWNITEGKTGWCNLLDACIGIETWKGGKIEAEAISTYNLNTPVADDLQTFSNLDAGPDKAFRLMQAGISQQCSKEIALFLGLRNIDTDHFTTPFTALFTGSSHGSFPILAENFPLASYPLSALCIHAQYNPTSRLTIRESVYNGVADDRLNRQFRFCPKSDGVFNIGSVTFREHPNNENTAYYTLGYALGSMPSSSDGSNKSFNYAVWGLIEQPIVDIGKTHLAGLLQGGASPAERSVCRGYWGAGIILGGLNSRNAHLGLAINRAFYCDGHETDLELTGNFPVCQYLTLQPAIHCINTNGHYIAAAQLRAVIEIGNY